MSHRHELDLLRSVDRLPGLGRHRNSLALLSGALLGVLLALGGTTVRAAPAYVTNFTATLASNQNLTVSFGVEGGSNGVPYNLYQAG